MDTEIYRLLFSNKDYLSFLNSNISSLRLLDPQTFIIGYHSLLKIFKTDPSISTILENLKDFGSIIKSPTKAEYYRSKGNKYFQNQSYQNAREFYTKCLIHSPTHHHQILAYSNRSAASFHLKEYELCLKDIHRAETLISESSSSNLTQYNSISYKLCKRKTIAISCLFKLHNKVLIEDVKKCWGDLMNMSGNKDKPDLEKQFKQFFPGWSMPSSSEDTDSRSSVNVRSDDESHRLNSSTTSARISYSKSAGRFLVATSDVDVGENIVMDSPFAIVPYLEHQTLNPRDFEGTSKREDTENDSHLQCSECARLLDPIPVICPSPQCTFHFCSLHCLRSSRFHTFECAKNWLQTLEPLSWLSFRVFYLVWFNNRRDQTTENCVNRLEEELVNVDLKVDTDSGDHDSEDSDFDPFVERPVPRKPKNRGAKSVKIHNDTGMTAKNGCQSSRVQEFKDEGGTLLFTDLENAPGCDENGCYHVSPRTIQSLSHHFHSLPLETISQYFITCSTLFHLSRQSGLFMKSVSTENAELNKDDGELLVKMVKMMSQVGNNSWRVRKVVGGVDKGGARDLENEDGMVEEVEEKVVALGLYLRVALANHSCVPTASLSFSSPSSPNTTPLKLADIDTPSPDHPYTATVYSTSFIPQNEEINISYGPLIGRMTKNERMKILTQGWGIQCDCVGCRGDERDKRVSAVYCQCGETVECEIVNGHGDDKGNQSDQRSLRGSCQKCQETVNVDVTIPICPSVLSLLHPLNSYRLAHLDSLAFQCILQNDFVNATKNLEIALKGLEWYHGWSGELGGWMSILMDDFNLDINLGTKKMDGNDERRRIILRKLRVDVPLLKEWIKFLKILGYSDRQRAVRYLHDFVPICKRFTRCNAFVDADLDDLNSLEEML